MGKIARNINNCALANWTWRGTGTRAHYNSEKIDTKTTQPLQPPQLHLPPARVLLLQQLAPEPAQVLLGHAWLQQLLPRTHHGDRYQASGSRPPSRRPVETKCFGEAMQAERRACWTVYRNHSNFNTCMGCTICLSAMSVRMQKLCPETLEAVTLTAIIFGANSIVFIIFHRMHTIRGISLAAPPPLQLARRGQVRHP